MAQYADEYEFNFPPKKVFRVLAAIRSHKQFVPLCTESTVISKNVLANGTREVFATYHMLHDKYRVDYAPNVKIIVDKKNLEFRSELLANDKSDFSATGVIKLTARADGGTKLSFDLTYQARGMLAILMPKRALSQMVFKKANEALEKRLKHLQDLGPKRNRKKKSNGAGNRKNIKTMQANPGG